MLLQVQLFAPTVPRQQRPVLRKSDQYENGSRVQIRVSESIPRRRHVLFLGLAVFVRIRSQLSVFRAQVIDLQRRFVRKLWRKLHRR